MNSQEDTITQNRPARMGGPGGLTGARSTVTAREAKARRSAMLDLISNGVSDDELIDLMQTNFPGISEGEIDRLKEKVKASVIAEYDERAPLFKALAVRRIHKHLIGAKGANQWGAVANLEGQLSRIQGTESASETHVTVDARLQQATLHVLGMMNPAEVNELVAEELRRLPKITSQSFHESNTQAEG